jgi:hypothetical protein
MDATNDWKVAAAGQEQPTRRGVAADVKVGEAPADRSAFAGRDDQRLIEEIAAEINSADQAGVRRLQEIIVDRMGRGDLSSLAAMRLLTAARHRLASLSGGCR